MGALRAAELEVLFTADMNQVDQADKNVQTIGRKIESTPITQTVTADTSGVVASATRVENAFESAFENAAQSSKGMSRGLVRDFLESGRASSKTADEIESVLVRSYGVAADAARDLARATKGELQIDVDAAPALASMARVEEAARQLVSQDTALKLDADVTRAETNLDRAKQRLEDLKVRALGGLDVTADVRRAEANLQRVERNLQGLQSARTMIEVDASTIRAEQELDGVADKAEQAGTDGGKRSGAALAGGIIAGLATIPIVGAVVKIGETAATALLDAFNDGLQVEVDNDRLQGLTGISEADALRLGRAAGAAYANVFGESIEANMDTTRLALQFDLIDANTATKGAQRVIEGLSGIADVLDEDVQPIAAAVTKMLNAGLVPSADAAFDIIAAGAREGVNLADDLLDTLGEYASTFSALGLSGDQALGLLNQGLEAGAPNADFFADSIRELGIKVREGDDATAGFLVQARLVPDVLAKAFAEGGPAAAAGLASVYDALNAIEDPTERNRVAVGILGTQFEDLQLDLSKLDMSTAVAQLNGVQGAAKQMFDTLSSNDATKLEQAQRNIEVATDGMKGALAAAFSEPLGDAAEWISANRGPMLQFMMDLANGAIDFGVSMVESTAVGTEALGEFVSGALRETVKGIRDLIEWLPGDADLTGLDSMIESMVGFDEVTAEAADSMRDNLIPKLEGARDKFNEFGDGVVAMGFLNDTSMRLAESLGQVGVDAEGAALSLESVDVSNIRASDSGKVLEGQVRNAVAALSDQVAAAATAGEGQEELADRYDSATEALVGQLTQMGLTEEQAQTLINTVLRTPASAVTEFGSNATDQQLKVQSLADRITTLPNGSVVISADTDQAQIDLDLFMANNASRRLILQTALNGSGAGAGILKKADGGVVEFMAQGGLHGLTPMSHTAQVVPPSTWRVVGDRGDVPESFIPLDGSARSYAILLETMRQMGVTAMGDGDITAGRQIATSTRGGDTWHISTNDPELAASKVESRQIRKEWGER
ncbi:MULTISPECIES: phage tail tape measure protein [Cryobacterium]|uniref:phage tail tape measure protein n=1 Tax=Cryobacterium TaxID=69578 RepID=UPI000CD4029A|nr:MULTISPECIES: phage tail tape measure protein [Cryobacterium]POH63636.1 hypothetical protein C3B60_16105 [Cryobacterium zongtaii]TFC45575.1 hypothetical protein E3O57_07980 [Cryobacterium sp. TMN-39-2]